MKKLYEESELKRLTTSEIDRMKDDTVFIQISETKFERKKDPEYDRYYDAYLCEVMDRDKYERRTFGKIRRGRGNRKRRGTQTSESGRNDRRNESRVQGTRTRVRRFTAGDRFVIQNTRSGKVKTRTRVSSIYKKEILTVLVMGINKSDTIIFNIQNQ